EKVGMEFDVVASQLKFIRGVQSDSTWPEILCLENNCSHGKVAKFSVAYR
ncbi:hypothetical protein STEG23_013183, partial [Scotinomys teguina]